MQIVTKKGFSFIELMIVIAIAGIMTAVSLVSMSAARQKRDVEIAAREVATAVREAQSYALTGKNLKTKTTDCKFIFTWESSSYKVSDCKDQSYSLKNNVTFYDGNKSLSFDVPFANITSAVPFPIDIDLIKGSTGYHYHVCIYESGIVNEQLSSCTP